MIYIHRPIYQGEYEMLYSENRNRNFIFFKVKVSKSRDPVRSIVVTSSALQFIVIETYKLLPNIIILYFRPVGNVLGLFSWFLDIYGISSNGHIRF